MATYLPPPKKATEFATDIISLILDSIEVANFREKAVISRNKLKEKIGSPYLDFLEKNNLIKSVKHNSNSSTIYYSILQLNKVMIAEKWNDLINTIRYEK